MAPIFLKTGLLILLSSQLHLTWAAGLVPRQQVTCDFEITASSGDTCQSFANDWGLSLQDFESINPDVTCPNLVAGQDYCVLGTISPGSTSSTSLTSSSSSPLTTSTLSSTTTSSTLTTSTVSPTTTTTSSPIVSSTPTPTSSSSAPNQPQQTGTAVDCDEFYLVQLGDSCGQIESQFDITASEFLAWNPSIKSDCTNLQAGYYYCVDVLGATKPVTITTASKTTSTAANGITTPTPHQTGMASNCNKFYLVVSGDQCGTIAAYEGISLADFYAWNPAVGSSCQVLGLGDYVCVGIIGATSSATTTTTTAITSTIPSNGIPTPTPYQTGMASNCVSFHLITSGDQCGVIATTYGISLTQFYAWNPAVGSSCQYLDLGDYVCVGVETCASASLLAGTPSSQGQLTCGAPGASHDDAGSLLITSYTAGSPYVESAAACGAQCLATPSCTNLYFIEGSYCNLHEGASTFAESTVAPYYMWYEAACFNSTCGAPGASHDNAGSLLITSYTAGSPYVESAAACGAQCLATGSCTNLYFVEGSYCNLHKGESTFAESTVAPFYYWYDVSCFSSGTACGAYGFSQDNPSTLITSYTSGSYVESAAACGAQCLSTSGCTNVYFIQGSYCNLHSPSTFYASTASGYYSWYQSSCFACNALSF